MKESFLKVGSTSAQGHTQLKQKREPFQLIGVAAMLPVTWDFERKMSVVVSPWLATKYHTATCSFPYITPSGGEEN